MGLERIAHSRSVARIGPPSVLFKWRDESTPVKTKAGFNCLIFAQLHSPHLRLCDSPQSPPRWRGHLRYGLW
jgi:hypothetical protein